MKTLAFYLIIGSLFLSQSIPAQDKQMQKEVEETIESLVQASLDGDVDKSMAFWLDNEAFTYIADGHTFNYDALMNLYADYLSKRERVTITEQSVTVKPLGKYQALCLWRGTEKVKMINQDETVVNWISTFIMENKKGGWVIVHGHTSHY